MRHCQHLLGFFADRIDSVFLSSDKVFGLSEASRDAATTVTGAVTDFQCSFAIAVALFAAALFAGGVPGGLPPPPAICPFTHCAAPVHRRRGRRGGVLQQAAGGMKARGSR